MMDYLESNRKKWDAQEAAEQAEETHTELSDAEPEQHLSDDEDEEPSKLSPEIPSITEFLPAPR